MGGICRAATNYARDSGHRGHVRLVGQTFRRLRRRLATTLIAARSKPPALSAQFMRNDFCSRRLCAGGISGLLANPVFCAGTLPALFEMNPASACMDDSGKQTINNYRKNL
jgi:hypothetical protein